MTEEALFVVRLLELFPDKAFLQAYPLPAKIAERRSDLLLQIINLSRALMINTLLLLIKKYQYNIRLYIIFSGCLQTANRFLE